MGSLDVIGVVTQFCPAEGALTALLRAHITVERDTRQSHPSSYTTLNIAVEFSLSENIYIVMKYSFIILFLYYLLYLGQA